MEDWQKEEKARIEKRVSKIKETGAVQCLERIYTALEVIKGSEELKEQFEMDLDNIIGKEHPNATAYYWNALHNHGNHCVLICRDKHDLGEGRHQLIDVPLFHLDKQSTQIQLEIASQRVRDVVLSVIDEHQIVTIPFENPDHVDDVAMLKSWVFACGIEALRMAEIG